MAYTLGSSHEEQERLFWQSKAYGDLDTLTFEAGITLVECGCGVGANLWIVPHFSIGKYIGFDISENQIARAKQTAEQLQIKNAEFFCEDVFNGMDLRPNTADVILIRLVLIHLKDPERALRHLLPILKPGGRLIVIEADMPFYRVGPNKDNLQKCSEIRCAYAYSPNRGSLNIASKIEKVFIKVGLSNVHARAHLIEINGTEIERMGHFLKAWATMMNSVSKDLVTNSMVTQEELDAANREAHHFDKNTYLRQRLIICEGIR